MEITPETLEGKTIGVFDSQYYLSLAEVLVSLGLMKKHKDKYIAPKVKIIKYKAAQGVFDALQKGEVELAFVGVTHAKTYQFDGVKSLKTFSNLTELPRVGLMFEKGDLKTATNLL